MSFSIQFTGHIEPADPAQDAKIRKLARAFADTLRAAGVDCYGTVATPGLNAGVPLDLPDGGALLVVDGAHLHTGTITAASTTPTGHKPK